MATLTNSIKKAVKITGMQPRCNSNGFNFDYKGYEISFHQNGRDSDDATGFYTRRFDLQDELISDYFAGTFHQNISQCFNFVDRMATR